MAMGNTTQAGADPKDIISEGEQSLQGLIGEESLGLEEGPAPFCLPCHAEQIPRHPESIPCVRLDLGNMAPNLQKNWQCKQGISSALSEQCFKRDCVIFFKPEDFRTKFSLGKKEIIKEIRAERKALR